MQHSKDSNTAFWRQVGKFTRKLANDGLAPPPGPPRPVRPPQPDLVTFAQRIRAVLADRGTASAGALYLINLDTVRQAFEAQGQWERLADRVNHICLKAIAKVLDAADLFHALPGPIFLIVFARLQPDAAKAKCAMIAGEIGRLLVGLDPTLKDVMVGAAAAQLQQGDVALDRSTSRPRRSGG
jgi:hypothetical protein